MLELHQIYMWRELTDADEREFPNKRKAENSSSSQGGETLDDAIQDNLLENLIKERFENTYAPRVTPARPLTF